MLNFFSRFSLFINKIMSINENVLSKFCLSSIFVFRNRRESMCRLIKFLKLMRAIIVIVNTRRPGAPKYDPARIGVVSREDKTALTYLRQYADFFQR